MTSPLAQSSSRTAVRQQNLSLAQLANLSRFQRILLATDGTVTKMLEQYLGESIKALKQYEKIEDRFGQLPDSHQSTITPEQLPVLYRKILLRGQSTLNNWVYAESSIVLNHIALEFRKDLLASTEPIGKLWLKYQVETCKTILETKQEKADDLAAYFNIQASDDLLTRTYKVNSNNRVTMLITEKFPMSFFLDM